MKTKMLTGLKLAAAFIFSFFLKLPNVELLDKIDEVRFVASLDIKLNNPNTTAKKLAEKDEPEKPRAK